jgi:hypothetical protein
MKTTLQELFLKCGGNPVVVDQHQLVQVGKVPIGRGIVRIKLLSPPNVDQGVRLKVKNGAIELTDGSRAESVVIWHVPGLPKIVTHRVDCPNNELLIWNTYRIHQPTGEVTDDYWTGNAAMALLESSPNRFRYGCSDWKGSFDPWAIEFEVEWEES